MGLWRCAGRVIGRVRGSVDEGWVVWLVRGVVGGVLGGEARWVWWWDGCEEGRVRIRCARWFCRMGCVVWCEVGVDMRVGRVKWVCVEWVRAG
jgi:hypothetical protein